MTERPRDTDPPHRPPPRVIRVPPPAPTLKSLFPWKTAAWLPAAVIALAVANFWTVEQIFLALFCTLVLLGIFTYLPRSARRRAAQARVNCLQQCPRWHEDPAAAQLADAWWHLSRPPKLKQIRRTLIELPDGHPQTGVVVCLGVEELPHVAGVRFEPEIIPPARRWREFLGAATAVAVVGTASFSCLSGLLEQFTQWSSRSAGGVLVLFVFLVLVGLFWIGQAVCFPEHVRFAPGIVQVLYYGPRRSKPGVVSYPLTGGTIAIVTTRFDFRRNKLSLAIARGKEVDGLRLDVLSDSDRAIERMWQALLSTAPTPPLSDEELLG